MHAAVINPDQRTVGHLVPGELLGIKGFGDHNRGPFMQLSTAAIAVAKIETVPPVHARRRDADGEPRAPKFVAAGGGDGHHEWIVDAEFFTQFEDRVDHAGDASGGIFTQAVRQGERKHRLRIGLPFAIAEPGVDEFGVDPPLHRLETADITVVLKQPIPHQEGVGIGSGNNALGHRADVGQKQAASRMPCEALDVLVVPGSPSFTVLPRIRIILVPPDTNAIAVDDPTALRCMLRLNEQRVLWIVQQRTEADFRTVIGKPTAHVSRSLRRHSQQE